jgi:hypothetical protein
MSDPTPIREPEQPSGLDDHPDDVVVQRQSGAIHRACGRRHRFDEACEARL